MSKYGLTVHPEKTRLVRFHPDDPDDSEPTAGDSSLPRTFDFLGFTHYWGRSREGGWVIKRKTARSRLKRAFQALSDWCRVNRHQPIPVQHQTLKQKLQGHYGYYGITGNFASLQDFLEGAQADLETMAVPASPGQTPVVDRFRATGAAVRSSQGTGGPQPASVAQRSHEMTSQMRVICTSGSVGAPGEQSPGATRPPKAIPIAAPGEGTIATRVAAGLGLRPTRLEEWHFLRQRGFAGSSPVSGLRLVGRRPRTGFAGPRRLPGVEACFRLPRDITW